MIRQFKVICLALSICMMISGCTGTFLQKPDPKPDVIKIEYNDSLLKELVYEGEYIEEGLEPISYCYHIPQIQADTEEIAEINRFLKSFGEDSELYYSKIDWNSHWNGSILSLIVKMVEPYQAYPEYYIYNYDFKRGSLLSNQELLDQKHVTVNDFTHFLREAVSNEFDRGNTDLDTLYGNCFEGLQDLRAQTLSDSNLSLEQLPLYLNDMGQYCAAVKISTPAAAGYYPVLLPVPFDTVGLEKETSCEFMSACLKANQVTVTFQKEKLAELLFPENVQFNHLYSIEGLYGNYMDMTMGFLGNDGTAYLLLTDTTGHVSFCNLTNGIKCGCLVATGPLMNPKLVSSVEILTDPDGLVAEAILEDGSKAVLDEIILDAEKSLHAFLQDSTWSVPKGEHTLSIRQEKTGNSAMWTDYDGGRLDGHIFYLGLTGEGMKYGYEFITDTGPICGTLTLDNYNTFGGPGSAQEIKLTCTGERRLPGIGQNQVVTLIRSWG